MKKTKTKKLWLVLLGSDGAWLPRAALETKREAVLFVWRRRVDFPLCQYIIRSVEVPR